MKLIVKIEKEDVGTFLLGSTVGIKTQLVDVVFSIDAMEELLINYQCIVKGKKDKFDGLVKPIQKFNDDSAKGKFEINY